jgi:NADPH:quinone reductase-like Zn-dependent oxidoreductase
MQVFLGFETEEPYMRAAIQHQPGATPTVGELEEPAPENGEVLIHVRTAGLGGWDVAGAYQAQMSYPCVLRGEGVGFTDDGRRVYFGEHARLPFGAFCERTVLPAGEVWEVPDDISDELAISMGIAGTGAFGPLERAGRVQPGDTVLVTGATGGLGQLGLQFARHLGAERVVAAGRDDSSLERLVQRGIADAYAVLRGTEHDVTALKEVSGGDGYDVVLDAIYGPYFSSVLKATKVGARLVTVGGLAGKTAPIPAYDLIYRWHCAWSMGRAPVEERRDTWLRLLELGRQGIDVTYRHFSFEQTPDAYEAQRSTPHAKVVVRIT